MKKHLFATAVVTAGLALGFTLALSAQALPDLSGTWVADAAKSDPAPAAAGRGRGGNPNQMVITKSDTELTVLLGGANYIYNLDGSERSGPPGGETKSKMTVQGGAMVVTWKREYFAGPDKGYLTSTGRDAYALDGGVLTVERMTAVPGQPAQTRKTVYNKAP
jgi:hypothetical protein